MIWFFFSQNNWHDGGNSTEQYARFMSSGPCVYVHGGKNKKTSMYNQMQIVPESLAREMILERKDVVAMFCKPTPLFLDHLKFCKNNNVRTVYRCVDDWESFEKSEWYNSDIEYEMIRLADVSFASSKKMANKFDVRYLPNACFKVEKSNAEDKIVGFIGLVDMDRFDMDLIEYLALSFPEVVFRLAGSKKRWQLPRNVQVFQHTDWQHAYELSKDFLVGIIPYKGKDLSGMQPIKSWEYLSRGIPQLCAKGLDLPEHESVFQYTDRVDCEKQLRFILENIKSFDRDKMIEFAHKNTWGKRIESIVEQLQ